MRQKLRDGLRGIILAAGMCSAAAADLPVAPEPFGMPYYTGTVFPTPQEAVYHDDFLSLDAVAVWPGKDVAADGMLLQILQQRLRECGGDMQVVSNWAAASAHAVVLIVGETDLPFELPRPPPSRPEGYMMAAVKHAGKDVVVLRGHDRRGLNWAVISLVQLLACRNSRLVLRRAEIYDYPAVGNRGYLAGSWGLNFPLDEAWYMLNFKMNKVVLRRHRTRDVNWRGVNDDVWASLEKTARLLNPLEIEWYFGYRALGNDALQVNCCGGEDLQVLLEHARRTAGMGGNFYLAFDDKRFPLHPEDRRRFGTAREADIYIVTRLYDGLRKTHPSAKLLFCPPFYYGPASQHSYDESREEYLEAIGARLPPEIGVFWTGGSVKSGLKTPGHVRWIRDLIKRKPFIFQNGAGAPHVYGYHYATDPLTSWHDWHYAGFFEEVDTFMLNTGMPGMSVAMLTLVDYLWNPAAYDAGKSVREACMKLAGPDSFALLQEINRLLSGLDLYGLQVSPAAAKNMEDILRQVGEMEQVWEKCRQQYAGAAARWTGMSNDVARQRAFLARLEKNPGMERYVDMAASVRAQAGKELAFTATTDILLTPVDFSGGVPPRKYGTRCEPRWATHVQGRGTAFHTMLARFEADPFPPAGDYRLIMVGQDNDRGAPVRIRVSVGEHVVFEGENGFARNGWSQREWRIPGMALDRYNQLKIENLEEGSVRGPPWFMLNCVLLRKTAE